MVFIHNPPSNIFENFTSHRDYYQITQDAFVSDGHEWVKIFMICDCAAHLSLVLGKEMSFHILMACQCWSLAVCLM